MRVLRGFICLICHSLYKDSLLDISLSYGALYLIVLLFGADFWP